MTFFKPLTKAQPFTVLFKNTQILKFKSQQAIAFFGGVNHLSRPLRKQNFTVTGSKSHSLWFVIGGFHPFFCVSVFQGSLLVILIWLTAAKSAYVKAAFELQSFLKRAVNQYPLCRYISLKQIFICWKNLIKDQSHSLWWSF